jgi:hypothetical protein
MPATEPSGPLELTFVTSVEASADAHALARPRVNPLDRNAHILGSLYGLLNIVLGVAWNSGALCAIGVTLLGLAGFSVIERNSHPVLRWMIKQRFASLLGKRTRVTVEERGVTLENEIARSSFPWSSVTVARSNPKTVAFFRDGLLLGYIPSSAFPSPEARRDVLAFIERHVTTFQRH